LVTVPLGLVGMLWSLYITGRSISMFVLLGGVMLIGIVVNNAILIMDQLNQLVAAGVPRHEAMARAAGTELRPVLMITLAAVLGMLPMALSGSLGSEMRNGIGIASYRIRTAFADCDARVVRPVYARYGQTLMKPHRQKPTL